MIRYGIVGSGMMGQEHIRNIALLEGTAIVAVADPHEAMRAEAAAQAGDGAKAFTDHRDLLSADLCDAYVVAAPNDLHRDLMLDLIAAGKPILCEKPLCTTTVDCQRVSAAADRAGVPVWVAMEYRYMPAIAALKSRLDAGVAGPPQMIAIREHRFPFLDKIGDWNRFNARTGGTLVEKCCHFWDLMRLMLQSDPVRVFASAAADVNHRDERHDGRVPDIIDNAYVIVDFASGARGMLDLCMFAEGAHWQEIVAVTGPKARVEARVPGPPRFEVGGASHESEIAVADRAQRHEVVERVDIDPDILDAGDHHGSTFYQHRHFRDLVRDGRRDPAVSLADGTWAVRVGEAAERSARSRTVVQL
ncbi:MAG: Gfo/Idh/MocA family oxidoreductase [Pseudomonadota bacterium]